MPVLMGFSVSVIWILVSRKRNRLCVVASGKQQISLESLPLSVFPYSLSGLQRTAFHFPFTLLHLMGLEGRTLCKMHVSVARQRESCAHAHWP